MWANLRAGVHIVQYNQDNREKSADIKEACRQCMVVNFVEWEKGKGKERERESDSITSKPVEALKGRFVLTWICRGEWESSSEGKTTSDVRFILNPPPLRSLPLTHTYTKPKKTTREFNNALENQDYLTRNKKREKEKRERAREISYALVLNINSFLWGNGK